MSMSSVERERRGARLSGSIGLLAATMAGVLSVAAVSESHAATFAAWASGSTGGGTSTLSISGTLGGTSLTMDVAGVGPFAAMGPVNGDLSNATNYVQPGSATQQVVNFPQDGAGPPANTTTTITFTGSVLNLGLYMKGWRGGNYTLTAMDLAQNNVAYSFISGSYSSTPTVSNNQFLLADSFTDGIIAFSGDVHELQFTYAPTGLNGNSQLTLGILATPVPGGGVAAVLGVAAAAARRRRR